MFLDTTDKKIYAYNMSDKAQNTGKEFATLDAAENDNPAGIWSDGTTMWISDTVDNKLYAYKLSDGSRQSNSDFNTLTDNDNDDP